MLRWMATIPWGLTIWFYLLAPKMSFWAGMIQGIAIGLTIMQIVALIGFWKEVKHDC